ncbi:AAA family ATPase [Paraburkholderia sp. SARCC-3016]|uniref:bifunctional aminoglycoside phosphotransferase/ATP-binding protein n=1 Tax=Paraburkholderia sp. SARCC-3016 TaxID=3058611 RepID=UPI002806ACBB|nr:AAA family ATPase [Paraburkholderia sp. SARCC-3016]MDQ7976823.1 AAA family ATPase [Paraburkholderia sp. SARCC-3016]
MIRSNVKGTPTLHAANRQRAARRAWRALDRMLRRPDFYLHPAGRIERRETHLSVVYLAGRFAYKIKKPVAFGFVDFTDADARRRSCEAEVRLNRTLAGPLYLGLVRIAPERRTRQAAASRAVGAEYAVRMRRFDERMLFSRLLAQRDLQRTDIDRAAARLALCHLHASRNVPRPALGSAALLRAQCNAVLDGCATHIGAARIEPLRRWCAAELACIADTLDARRATGFVRSCHGDLHLNNIVRWRDTVLMFDCIEFDDALRWIDIANDLAFVLMDLRASGRADLAARMLNRWLETSGDYGALVPLRFYIVYRALVRAYVARLGPQEPASLAASERYLDTAVAAVNETATGRRQCLLLCHGFSGSGKSVASRALADLYPAIRLSSDAQRKRIGTHTPPERAALRADSYTSDKIDRVYGALLETAEQILRNGYSVIVDATFLQRKHRAAFLELAHALGVRAVLLDFHASDACMAARVSARARARNDLSDADVAVLEMQRTSAEPLTADERTLAVTFDTEVPLSRIEAAEYWESILTIDQRQPDARTRQHHGNKPQLRRHS